MRRVLLFAAAASLLPACAGHAQRARVAAHDDLSAIQAVQTQVRASASGAPVMGVTISGTITNTDAQPLRCNAIAFLLVDARGDALAPATHFCDMPAIAPNDSGYFSATFDPRTTDDLHLRFQHPDGSYETHDVIVPPA